MEKSRQAEKGKSQRLTHRAGRGGVGGVAVVQDVGRGWGGGRRGGSGERQDDVMVGWGGIS